MSDLARYAVREISRLAHTVLLGMLLVAGCAHGPEPGSTREAYREMRAAEANLERGQAALRGAEGDAREDALHSLCEAATRICALAEELQEADARARCDDARRRCEAAGGQCCGAEDP